MRKIGKSHNSISRAMDFCGSFSSCVHFLEGIAAGYRGPMDTIL